MLINNALRQLVRTPVRTGLFVLFLAAVTTFLTFGMYMWVSVNNSLARAQETFTTAAFMEYSSRQGIDANETIMNSPYVEFMDQREWLGAYGEGIKPTTPSRIQYGNGIIVFEPLSDTDGEIVPIKILEVLAAGKRFQSSISAIWCPDYPLEPGKQYIAGGGYSIDLDAFVTTSMLDFPSLAEIPEGDREKFFADSAGQLWLGELETFARLDNSLTVLATKDLDIVYAFHQGNAVTTTGRSFTQQEYEESARVCLISVALAQSNNLQLGDSIELTLYDDPSVSKANDTGPIAKINTFSRHNATDSYEIVGMYALPIIPRGSWYDIDKDTIILPRGRSTTSSQSQFMEGLISCRLTNGTGDDFAAEMEAANLTGITITIYDQGYSKISNSLTSMGKTALVLIAICLGAGLILTLLFTFLYVGRQKNNIAVMFSLGTSRSHVLGFLSATVGIVAVSATLLGGMTGYALAGTVLNSVYQQTGANIIDTTYSVIAAGSEIPYQVLIPEGISVPATAVGAILFLTLALGAAFSVNALRAEPLQLLARRGD